MSLDAASRRLHARQILLAQVGEAGQERLSTARFRVATTSDAAAVAVATEYLRRAGCTCDVDGEEVRIPDQAAVLRFAGHPALHEAAAAIIGAFCAVEHLRAVLGLGAVREFPSDLRLTPEV